MTILVTTGDDTLARKRLAQLIKELRGQATQREFAKLLGTSYTAIQDWEKQIRLPKEENLKRIALLKGWDQAELLRYLFLSDDQSTTHPIDPVETIITQVQALSPHQIQRLSDYLNGHLNQVQHDPNSAMIFSLNDKQKGNLHLLLKASLKKRSPIEAMGTIGIDPGLFTDIFLRNEKSRVVDEQDLKKFSCLCCRVIRWRIGQLPEVDYSQTYAGKTLLLFNDLDGENQVIR